MASETDTTSGTADASAPNGAEETPAPGIPDHIEVERALEAILMIVDEPQSLVSLASFIWL